MATCTSWIRGSGFGFDPNGPATAVKIWKVSAANGTPSLVYNGATTPGLKAPALGIAVKDDDNIFVNDNTGLNRVHRDGTVQHLLDLPVQGDHDADHIAIGKDGMLYWGQGSATNSGVVGEDNQSWVAQGQSAVPRHPVQGRHPERPELHQQGRHRRRPTRKW